ncbi:hypothetical protein BJF77_18435 [Kocuria sp. CNJ-770]|uniref:lytic transglycosylase domain-containing protein n=1 Tax=Kocuria sp. CNJ-770 TaxID=1904964 RepID=UPI00095E8709|nr:lytic transglycosylase domain-containing protein [Kocuria sp. CNJ-770]OLT13106.1 hypothetical protein BJF77_18435 [Kocuria sp. CNJ-770]
MSAGSSRALGAIMALLLVFAIGSIVALAVLVATLAEDEEQTSATSCAVTAVTTDDDQERAPNIPNGWAPLVEEAAKTAGLPVSVVAAQLKQESNWDAGAGSSAGAQGIAQFMPATWATYGNGGEVTDPDDAIPAYGRYMAALKKDVEPLADGDADQLVRLTLAAYNAGPGPCSSTRVCRPMRKPRTTSAPSLTSARASSPPTARSPPGRRNGTVT